MESSSTSQTTEVSNTSQTKGTSQRWCITLNNYTDEELKQIRDPPDWVQYIGFSFEEGKSGTPHVQAWVYTWQPIRMTKFKIFLRRAHVEMMIASLDKNDAYCSKEARMEHVGTRPAQGRRTDIIGVKRRLDDGESFADVMSDEATFGIVMRNERALRAYSSAARYKRYKSEGFKPPKVYVRVGPTRSGKTSYVYKQHGYDDVFMCPYNSGQWFDGYGGESVILFDDVEADKVPPVELFKRITDGQPGFQAPIKGGTCYMRPDYIYFTSNHTVKDWWPQIKSCDWAACKERITQVVRVFKGKPDEQVFPVQDGGQEEAVGTSQEEVVQA